MKKAKGRMATRVRLRLNQVIISGIRGPMIFVKNEMTKNVSITILTM